MKLDKGSMDASRSCCAKREAGAVDRVCGLHRLHIRRFLRADPWPRGRGSRHSISAAWEWFWILFYGFATYGNAGLMREQVCKYMCPYARFQSAMFDRNTLIISYDAARGEPRGSRGRGTAHRSPASAIASTARCACRPVPTGIDIRQGLQYECIACAACIDACDSVMDKVGYAARPGALLDAGGDGWCGRPSDPSADPGVCLAAAVAGAGIRVCRDPSDAARRRRAARPECPVPRTRTTAASRTFTACASSTKISAATISACPPSTCRTRWWTATRRPPWWARRRSGPSWRGCGCPGPGAWRAQFPDRRHRG